MAFGEKKKGEKEGRAIHLLPASHFDFFRDRGRRREERKKREKKKKEGRGNGPAGMRDLIPTVILR